tara:strand:+ start:146682 stop:148052 length:1371 start_codon:yes stop_codon:yes gene_type:complete
VNKKFTDIEDFVREKLSFLDGTPTNDWADFERKLKRAVFLRRLKRATGVIGLMLLLFAGQQYFDFYTTQQALQTENKRIESSAKLTTSFSNKHYSASADGSLLDEQSIKRGETAMNNSSATSQNADYLAVTNPKKDNLALKATAQKNASAQAKNAESKNTMEEEPLVFEFSENVTNISATGLAYVDNLLNDYLRPTMDSESIVPSDSKDFFSSKTKKKIYISPLQEKDPWSYSLNIYPNFAFRKFRVDPNKRARLHSDFIDAMVNSEASGLNLNLGFEVNKRIGLITYVNTGVEYIRNSYLAEFDFVNFRNANIDYSTGEITSYTMRKDPNRIVFSNTNSFHYLNFPLSISHQPWASENVRINLEVGFSLLYFLKAQGSTIDYRSLEVIALSERSYRKFMGSSSLKIGLQYYVNPKLNIGLEPTLMYFTNSIYTEEYPFEVIPYSMGLNVNLQLKL